MKNPKHRNQIRPPQNGKNDLYKCKKVETITYEKAWESLGGDNELKKYTGQSKFIWSMVVDSNMDKEMKSLLRLKYLDHKSYSTALVNQRYVQSLEELYNKANKIFPKWKTEITSLATKTGGLAIVPPVKGEVRARMKALYKYRDDRIGDDQGNVAWYHLTDLVRGTIQYNSISEAYIGAQALVDHFKADVLEMNDRYHNPMPGGYRDIQFTIKCDDHLCELQINTEPMIRAKMTTGHRYFEVIRELQAAVKEGDILRVKNSLAFGETHLGCDSFSENDKKESSYLGRLLQSKSANTLLHQAASKGYANIIHTLLLHGADPDIQNEDGDTPLHLAVFHGYEPCVWVLLDAGNADMTLKNNEGQTALVKGYILTWMKASEYAIRAVSTLAHKAGIDAVIKAKNAAKDHIKKMQHNSSILVEYASDGRLNEMLHELRNFADPNSTRDGYSAMEKAILGYKLDAVKVLLDFKAVVDVDLFFKIPPNLLRTNEKLQEIMKFVCEEGKIPHVTVAKGSVTSKIIGMKKLEIANGGNCHLCYNWTSIPFELEGIPITCHNIHLGDGLELSVTSYGSTIGFLISYDVNNADDEEAKVQKLSELGFTKLRFPSLAYGIQSKKRLNDSKFKYTCIGADLWQLSPSFNNDLDSDPFILRIKEDINLLDVCFFSESITIDFQITVLDGDWKWKQIGLHSDTHFIRNNHLVDRDGNEKSIHLKCTRFINNVQQFTDQDYTWTGIPFKLRNVPMSVNPCHTGNGLKIRVSNLCTSDASVGILIGEGTKNAYSEGYQSLNQSLNNEGNEKTNFPNLSSTSPHQFLTGAELWTLPIRGSNSVDITVEMNVEINILYLKD